MLQNLDLQDKKNWSKIRTSLPLVFPVLGHFKSVGRSLTLVRLYCSRPQTVGRKRTLPYEKSVTTNKSNPQ